MSSASPAKKRASTGKPKKVASHPTYAQMSKMAIQSLKERNGSSKAAILKYILSHYKVGDNVKSINAHLRAALVRGVKSGAFKQVKGTGASGSFRLAEKAKAPAKKASPKKKATKPKAAGAAKPKAKKPKATPKKAAKASPKKAKSPKKPKTPKKAASPKKASPKKATPKKSSPKKSPKKATPKK